MFSITMSLVYYVRPTSLTDDTFLIYGALDYVKVYTNHLPFGITLTVISLTYVTRV